MNTQYPDIGKEIYALAERLFPVHRSITGNGVRDTHDILRTVIPELVSHEIPTGTKCFDWTIPDEWNVTEAYIAEMNGRRVIDFAANNLHLVSYSTPIDAVVSRETLMDHLHSLKDDPDAIPFITSYFNRDWGFAVTENQRSRLNESHYRVTIKSTLEPGSLTYGEILVPGKSSKEIVVHTYTCHPAMGNNETSGMAVAAYLARSILDMPERHFSYRIVFVPETIGAVAYISRNLAALRRLVIAGFVMTCVGDDRTYSLMPARKPGSLPERAARHVLNCVLKTSFETYSYLQRGSDERQYCAPGIDLPVVSIMRSKYSTYPEYHTSKDDMSVLSPSGLMGGFLATRLAIDIIEQNETLVTTVLCEPWLSPRGLRAPLVNGRFLDNFSKTVSQLVGFCDGEHDLLSIADMTSISFFDLVKVAEVLKEQEILKPTAEATPPGLLTN